MTCKCGNDILPRRAELGFTTCTECGEVDAQTEILAKSKRIAPAYSKGPYMYMGDGQAAKDNFKCAGQKNVALEVPVTRIATSQAPKVNKQRRKRIGVYFIGRDSYVLYEGDDPKKKGATRWSLLK